MVGVWWNVMPFGVAQAIGIVCGLPVVGQNGPP